MNLFTDGKFMLGLGVFCMTPRNVNVKLKMDYYGAPELVVYTAFESSDNHPIIIR